MSKTPAEEKRASTKMKVALSFYLRSSWVDGTKLLATRMECGAQLYPDVDIA